MKSKITKKAFTPGELILIDEVPFLFSSSKMLKENSFYIIDHTNTYDTLRMNHSYQKEAEEIRKAFLQGKSIRVTNMEKWNLPILNQATEYGYDTDVHMYLTPNSPNATAFAEHTDDRDVHIVMVYGKKTFYIEGIKYELEAGDELFIPQGDKHYAIPNGASCHLSFGTPKDEAFTVAGSIQLSDIIPVE